MLAGGTSSSIKQTLTLGAANTFSGDTVINNVAAGTGNFVQLNNANALQNSSLNNNSGLTIKFNSGIGTFNLGGLKGTAPLVLQDITPSAITLNVGGNGQNTEYDGVLSGSSGALTKTGTGTLTLTNVQTYNG